MWQNAIDSKDIFDENDQVIDEYGDFVNNQERNGFVRIKFHWSEDKTKGDDWYNEQKRDLNFDTRLINQELDLVFVGSTNCIFDDDFLSKLSAQSPVDRIKLPHAAVLNMFNHRNDLDKTDYLIIGCDTAKSLAGDYNALQLYMYSNMSQVGEYFGKLGSLTKYSECIMALIDVLAPIMNNRLILAIENNSIGTAIIENLENETNDNSTNTDYMQYIYSPSPEKYIGLNTNAKTKSAMVSYLYDYIIDEPQNIKSSDLINQLNIIERKINGSISAQSGYHDDLFMSSALCAYVRRLSSLEFEPLLGVSTVLQQQRHAGQINSAITVNSSAIQGSVQARYNQEEGGIEYMIYDNIEDGGTDDYDTPFSFV